MVKKGQADSYKISPSDIMHRMLTTVNNAVSYLKDAQEKILKVLIEEKNFLTMHSDEC